MVQARTPFRTSFTLFTLVYAPCALATILDSVNRVNLPSPSTSELNSSHLLFALCQNGFNSVYPP
jgi:hypothetical protein